MSSDPTTDDRITAGILSDSAYERLRVERYSVVGGSLERKLAVLSGLLGLLALTLPLYALYPPSVEGFLPTADPLVASPKPLLMGLVGLCGVLGSAALLVGAGLYRLRYAPLSESQAHSVLNVEEFAGALGIGTAGLAVLVTDLLFALGLGGGDVVELYARATGGGNPYVPSGVGVPVAVLALVALSGGLAILLARAYLVVRL